MEISILGASNAGFGFWVISICMKEVAPHKALAGNRRCAATTFGRNLEKTSFSTCKVLPRHLDDCNIVKLIVK